MDAEFICIGCPMGCLLTATQTDTGIKITGNSCKIGNDYGIKEMTNPCRTLTANVRITGADIPVLSVKSKQDIPKDKIFECVQLLRNVTVQAPSNIGDIIISNICGCGVDVISTKNLQKI